MSKAPNLSGRATPRLKLPFFILAVCLLSAFAAAAPATAPSSRDLSAQARQDPRTTIVSPGQGAAREEAARPASQTDPAHVSPASQGQDLCANFAMLQLLVGAAVTLGLDETAAAVRLLAERARVIAEGAGALSVAAALSGRAGTGRIVCIVSGGNIDASRLAAILEGRTPA
jgi:threonine dehydratase